MVYAAQVRREEAEKLRVWLKKNGFYLNGFKPKLFDGGFVLFPVKPSFIGNPLGVKVIRAKLNKIDRTPNLRLPFDIVGDVCIFKEGRKGVRYSDEISKVRKMYRFINTFYVKRGRLEGVERVPKLEFLGGEDKEVTLHTENGLKFIVNIKKTYFNPRLATERRHLCGAIQPNEQVLDMFAGVGPFSITIAKFKGVKVDALDVNPWAIDLLKKNIELNRVEKLVTPHHTDASDFSTDVKYDRIIMNLPFNALSYLEKATSLCGETSTIHIYLAQKGDKRDYIQDITQMVDRSKKILSIEKSRVIEYAPRLYIERYDLQLSGAH